MGPVLLTMLGLGVLGGASLVMRRKRARGTELLEDEVSRRRIAEILGDPDGSARSACLVYQGAPSFASATGIRIDTAIGESVFAPRSGLVVSRGRGPSGVELGIASLFERSSIVISGLDSSPHLIGTPLRAGSLLGGSGPVVLVAAHSGWVPSPSNRGSAVAWLGRAGVRPVCFDFPAARV